MTLRLAEHRTRDLAATDFHLRAATPDDGDDPDGEGADDVDFRFVGHPAVFMSGPDDMGVPIGNPLTWGFYERIDPSAFDKTIQEFDQRFLIDHDTSMVVSRKSAGTLAVSVDMAYGDGGGLLFDSALDQRLSYVRDLCANVDNKNVTGMSIGFIVIRDQWEDVEVDAGDLGPVTVERRTILEAQLLEGSAVTFPAYDSTDAQLNAAATAYEARGDSTAFERHPELLAVRGERTNAGQRRAPAETTRETENPPAETTGDPLELLNLRHKANAIRYGL